MSPAPQPHSHWYRVTMYVGPFLLLLALLCFTRGANGQDNIWRSEHGEITVGIPKVWRFDRVYPLLDGLLRDVESISLAEVRDLDPNKVHSTSLDFVQSVFALGIQFDQAAALKNRIAVERLEAEQRGVVEELRLHRDHLVGLRRQQNALAEQLEEAMKLQLEAQKRANTAQSEEEKAMAQKEVEAQGQTITLLRAQQEGVSTQINEAEKARPAQFEVQTTGASAPDLKDLTTTTNQLQTFWNRLPEDVQKQLGKDIGRPGLPATKQMDNFLTLLHERMARLLAVVNDDISRADREVFLMQFDVGIFPGGKAKHQVAGVEYGLTATCENGETVNGISGVYAYELYPGQSSYNISQFYGKTRTTGLVANVLTLFGLGVSAEYKKQREQLRSSLVQSVYISGFGAGGTAFGWYYAPGPFELRVSPGIRTTYAIVVAPRCKPTQGRDSAPSLSLKVKATTRWLSRDQSKMEFTANERELGAVKLPSQTSGIQVEQIDYIPKRFNSAVTKPASRDLDTTVQILLREEIDPNLVVTVNGRPLRRVRDWRGRATEPGAGGTEVILGEESDAKKTKRVTLGRGLIEANSLEADTWFAINPRLLLLRIAQETALTNAFPVIRLGDASGRGGELLSLIRNSESPVDARVDEWEFKGKFVNYYPQGTFLPLFIDEQGYMEGFAPGELSAAIIDRLPTTGLIKKLFMRVTPRFPPPTTDSSEGIRRMREDVLVVLVDAASDEHAPHWPLSCDESVGRGEFLVCVLDEQIIKNICKSRRQVCPSGLDETKLGEWLQGLSVWVDQAPYNDIVGLWGSASVQLQLRDQRFTFGSAAYRIVPNEMQGRFESWTATISSQQLKPGDKVRDLENLGIIHSVPPNRKFLEIIIPKNRLGDIPVGTMALERQLQGKWEEVSELPELRSQLMPKNLDIRSHGGDCTIAGERLEAIDAVVLRAPGEAGIERKGNQLVVGAGQIRFSLPKGMSTKSYDVKLGIGNVLVNATNSSGQQLRIEAATCGVKSNPE